MRESLRDSRYEEFSKGFQSDEDTCADWKPVPQYSQSLTLLSSCYLPATETGTDCDASRLGIDLWYIDPSSLFAHSETSTCRLPRSWYAKHQNDRGPCKHNLAAQIFLGIQ